MSVVTVGASKINNFNEEWMFIKFYIGIGKFCMWTFETLKTGYRNDIFQPYTSSGKCFVDLVYITVDYPT